jgi:hypothetical protein
LKFVLKSNREKISNVNKRLNQKQFRFKKFNSINNNINNNKTYNILDESNRRTNEYRSDLSSVINDNLQDVFEFNFLLLKLKGSPDSIQSVENVNKTFSIEQLNELCLYNNVFFNEIIEFKKIMPSIYFLF